MEPGASKLDIVGEDMIHVGSINETVLPHLVEGVGLTEELEHPSMPGLDHGREPIDELYKRLSSFDDALVMKRHVEVGLFVADPGQAGLEVFEVAPDVAVVRAKPGEIYIGQEEDTVAYPEPAVASSVSW